MIFADIEQAIAQRLAPLRDAGIHTRALPNKPAEWGEASSNGLITLTWQKDEFQRPTGTSQVIQKLEMLWRLDIRLKNLRDSSGCWAVIQEVTKLLLGFQPPHCDALYLRSREFLGELEGVWVCEAVFAAPTYVIQWDEPPTTNPIPLSGIFVLDQYGGLELGTAAN